MANTSLAIVSDSASLARMVTLRVDGQIMGIPVEDVREVLHEQKVTHVPLMPHEITGVLNLRGRIVTAVDMRRKLNLSPREVGRESRFVVIENKGDLYSLIVDSVGDVITIPSAAVQPVPPNLETCWREIASGVHELQNELLLILNPKAFLSFSQ